MTRFYDGTVDIEYDDNIPEDLVDLTELTMALDEFAKGARRMENPEVPDDTLQGLRTTLTNWVEQQKDSVQNLQNLRSDTGCGVLAHLTKNQKTLDQDTYDI